MKFTKPPPIAFLRTSKPFEMRLWQMSAALEWRVYRRGQTAQLLEMPKAGHQKFFDT
jgi:hypothetical protein